MGSIVMGLIAGPLCLWGVSGLKRLLKVDDVCDVFGVHGVGGILGAILTGVFCAARPGRRWSPKASAWRTKCGCSSRA